MDSSKQAQGAVYHVDYNPPKVEDVCGNCGGELYQRDDDKVETVKTRLYIYYKQTSPLIGYYFAKDLLVEIDGSQQIEVISESLRSLVAQKVN